MDERVYTINEIRDFVLPLLLRYKAEQGVLFGSYARNEADVDSDIDLMVVGGKDFDPTDIFCIAEELYRVAQKAVDVYEEREIDEQSPFFRSIMAEGVVL